jgi:hypothetical protein
VGTKRQLSRTCPTFAMRRRRFNKLIGAAGLSLSEHIHAADASAVNVRPDAVSTVPKRYDFDHDHSTAHEVLGFADGHAKLMLGGENGHELEINAGMLLSCRRARVTANCRRV